MCHRVLGILSFVNTNILFIESKPLTVVKILKHHTGKPFTHLFNDRLTLHNYLAGRPVKYACLEVSNLFTLGLNTQGCSYQESHIIYYLFGSNSTLHGKRRCLAKG